MRRRAAVLASAVLALTLAACGDDDEVDRGNPGDASQGPKTVETGPTTLGSTGEDQPEITQTQTAPYP